MAITDDGSHRTYEALRDAMRARIESMRDAANPSGRGFLQRLLFELAGYEVAGPRPLAHSLKSPDSPEAAGEELRLLQESRDAQNAWEEKVKAAGIDPEDFV